MELKKLALAAGLAASYYAAPALATSIPLPGGIAILEDDNIEYIMDAQGNLIDPDSAAADRPLAVGDTLHAVITFDKVQLPDSSTFAELGATDLELTGISVIEVKSIVNNTIIFGTNSAFETTYGSGAIAALFAQNPGDLFTSCNTGGVAGCETAATNGDPWMTVGFGDEDDFWFASGGLDLGGAIIPISASTIADVADGAATTKFGVANYNLSVLENNTGRILLPQYSLTADLRCTGGLSPAGCDGYVDIIGSGDILGGAGLTGPWFARSDFDFQINVVPVPATLGIMGLGLLGLGFSARRKKHAA